MTDAELSSLEDAARAATPGPWEYDVEQGEYHGVWAGGRYIVPSLHIDADNCKYIAAANPKVILGLLAELRQAKAERDWLARQLDFENCCVPSDLTEDPGYCLEHECMECGLSSAGAWLDAAKEAVCHKK